MVYEVHLNLLPGADPATDDTSFVGHISVTPAPGTQGSAYGAAPATTPHIARVSLSFTP